ncbi:MAG: hypothetical protein HUU35_14910, partial [Armatimonadetes bacterium]|nr:hypothetical protein [Armatimonadota bacterium]
MRVLTDFPGGGAADIRIDGSRISFDAPAHNCPQPMWFCLRVVEAAGQPLELVVRNAGRCLGGDTMAATRPVVGVDGEWSRVPDEQVWYDHEAHQLHFRLTPASDQVTVAYCYPYQLADLQRRLAELAAHPHLERLLLGRSPAGRPLEAVRVTDPSANGRKQLIWCVARQHAGEVPGSFVFEGLLEAWLAATPEAAQLRRETVLCALPMVDVDAVETGSYGKDQSPVDFNRDWTACPHHPAIARLLETIAEDAAQHDYRLFLDLHAPHPSGVSFLVPARGLLADPGGWDEHWRLGALLEAASAPPVRLADYPPHSLDWELRLADSVATEANRRSFGTIATTLEIAYHRDASGELVGPTSWRAVGAALTGAIARWLA